MMEIASASQLRAGLLRWVIVLVPGMVLLGFVSGVVSGSGPGNTWFAALVKPAIYPAPQLFPIVWTTLYVLMGVALAVVIVARRAPGRGMALAAFGLQLVLNLAWSPVFFAAHQMALALGVVVAMDVALIATIVLFARVRPLAAGLLVPYLAWAIFASVLNWQFLDLNRAADGQGAPPAGVVRMNI